MDQKVKRSLWLEHRKGKIIMDERSETCGECH